MIIIGGSVSGIGAEVDTTPKALRSILYDSAGNKLARPRNTTAADTDEGLPILGVNEGSYRRFRLDRTGAMATSRLNLESAYQLYTAALPPTWNGANVTMTITHATATGTLLNAGGTGAVSTYAGVVSQKPVSRVQNAQTFMKTRARLIKGGANGQAYIGLNSASNPTAVVPVNGFVFLYGVDGTIKPTVYVNSVVITQGTDIASLILSTQYYTWDIVVDDDAVVFAVYDASTGVIVDSQELLINVLDARFGMTPYFYPTAISYVTSAAANVGAATQLYIADMTVHTVDIETNKPWSHTMAAIGNTSLINPTIAVVQLANYANSAAPASATLSNTAAGYTTLGGQFQFAAVAGAETDYALFAFSVPIGVTFYCTGIAIDTMNTGAAVATTETWLQWFLSANALAATLATNTFRMTLGNQVFPIAAAIGAQSQPIVRAFSTPVVTPGSRVFHIGLKIPRGTATASQIIRGSVAVEGYFE